MPQEYYREEKGVDQRTSPVVTDQPAHWKNIKIQSQPKLKQRIIKQTRHRTKVAFIVNNSSHQKDKNIIHEEKTEIRSPRNKETNRKKEEIQQKENNFIIQRRSKDLQPTKGTPNYETPNKTIVLSVNASTLPFVTALLPSSNQSTSPHSHRYCTGCDPLTTSLTPPHSNWNKI